jgi:large subunit ribosomal protein L1
VGRLSFTPEKIQENVQAFLDFIDSLKPNSIKGVYVKGISLAATMSPGVPLAA